MTARARLEEESFNEYDAVDDKKVKFINFDIGVINFVNNELANGRFGDFMKRGMDIVIAAMMCVMLAPVILVLLAIVSLDGGFPIFGHERVGRDGKRFRCWKIRSMVVDAPAKLEALLRADPARAAEWRDGFKLNDDPRITRIGGFLRKTSLDELPQLWNVLVGEMSLVGPRPVTAQELVRYGRGAAYYCTVRPGVTGLWQVMGRNETTYSRRVAIDRFYVRSRSLLKDVAILFMTVPAVLNRTGQ